MYKAFILVILTFFSGSFLLPSAGDNNSLSENRDFVGSFEAEDKSHQTRFVRVLYAGEGSEREDGGDSTEQLTFNSVDPQGNSVEVYRFQIVTKNTGYDELQTSKDGDFKLKSVVNGAKIHIEVPLENGEMQLDRAYIGSLAYNFGTRETRNNVSAEDVSEIDLNVYRLDLPEFGEGYKPGDNGIIYNDGYLHLEMAAKAKYIDSDQIGDFTVTVDGEISITHVRGQERSDRAVIIDEEIVKKNI